MSEGSSNARTHAHDAECDALYREWQRYDAAVRNDGGYLDGNTVQNARRERDMFERQLRAIGCSGEARAQDEQRCD